MSHSTRVDGRTARVDYSTRWTPELCERFFELVRQHGNNSRVVTEELGLYSESTIKNAILELAIGGPEQFCQTKVEQKYTEYTDFELKCIAETCIRDHYECIHASALFNVRAHKVAHVLKLRYENGAPLDNAYPLEPPVREDHEFTNLHRATRKTFTLVEKPTNTKQAAIRNRPVLGPFKYDGYQPDHVDIVDLEEADVHDFPTVTDKNDPHNKDRSLPEIERDKNGFNKDGQFVGKSQKRHVRFRGQSKVGSLKQAASKRYEASFKQDPKKLTEDELASIEACYINYLSTHDAERCISQIEDIVSTSSVRSRREAKQLAQDYFDQLVAEAKENSKHHKEYITGQDAKDVDISNWFQAGRNPDIKPFSPGWEELPAEIKVDVLSKSLKCTMGQLEIKDNLIQQLEKKNLAAGIMSEKSLKNLKFLLIKAYDKTHFDKYSITKLAEAVGITRSEFYARHPDKKVSSNGCIVDLVIDHYAHLKACICFIFYKMGGSFGAHHITRKLPDICKVAPAYDLVHETMKTLGLKPKPKKSKTQYDAFTGHCGTAAPEIVHRANSADAPYTLLATDITQKLVNIMGKMMCIYISIILDVGMKQILSISFSTREKDSFVTKQFELLFEIIKPLMKPGQTSVLQSDNGHHNRNPRLVALCKENGVERSMSVPGQVLDNAIIEIIFAVLARVAIEDRCYASVTEAIESMKGFARAYNDSLLAPVPSVYGSHYEHPEVRSNESMTAYQGHYDEYDKANQIRYLLLTGEDRVTCPPSENDIYKIVLEEMAAKAPASQWKQSEAKLYAKVRLTQLRQQMSMSNQ